MIKTLKKKIYNFLTWTQKWTKTDMIYIAKSSFWLNLEKIVLNLTSFFSAILFANLLSKESYGVYQYILSVFTMLSFFTLNGIAISLTKSVAQGFEGDLLPGLKEKIKWGTLGSVISLTLSVYYFFNGNTLFSIAFIITSFFIPFTNSFYLYSSLLVGRKNFKKFSQYNIITKTIPTAFVIITLIATKNILIILAIYLLTNTLMDVFLFFRCIKTLKPNEKRDEKTLKFGKQLSLINILSNISKQIDKMLTFHYLGAVYLAIYSFALMPIQKIQTPLNSLNRLAFPKLSQRTLSELKKSVPQRVKKLMIILLPIVLIYILLIPYFYKLLLPQYTDAIIYSQVLAFSILLFPKTLLSQALISQRRKKEIFILNTTIPSIKIMLFLILLPQFKLWGLVTTLLFSDLIYFILASILFKKIKE